MALLGTLQLELSAPTDRLSADLDRAQQIIDGQNVTMKRKMGEVSKPLVMSVDDKALTALNKHLTLKQEHYKTVQEEFAKPIKIGTTRVDTRELDNLDRRVEKYKKEDYFKFKISGGTTPSSFEGIRNQVSRLVLSPIAVPIKVLQSGINSFARGIFEGLTRDISRSFTQSFANTTNKFIERKTGKSMIQMGKEAGSYTSKNAYLWAEYISRAQGYEGGLKGVGTQVKEIGNSIDSVANPRRFRKGLRNAEDRYVSYQEAVDRGDDEEAGNIRNQALVDIATPFFNATKRAAGVGLRIGAQPFRLRKKARLATSLREATAMSQKLEIPNYDREAAEKAESINVVMGGIDFNGTRNTAFASNLMEQILPKGYTVPLTTPFSNDPIDPSKSENGLDRFMHEVLVNIAKPGGYTREDLAKLGKMPIVKLLEIAVAKGYNPDAIRGYAHVKKIREMHPDKQINVMGTSGGSANAEEIISLAEKDGDKNVRGLGIGLPFFGLTGTAGSQFKGTVGDQDPLALIPFGSQYSKRKLSKEEAALLKESVSIPFDLGGIFAPNRSQGAIIPNAGEGHNIGKFAVNADFQKVATAQFKGAFTNPDLVGRQGIVNLNPYVEYGKEDLTIPRSIKAMFGDAGAKKEIEQDGEYSFFHTGHPDWRRDGDFASMKDGVRKKNKSAKGLPREHADEYMGFLDTMHEELTAFYESEGAILPYKTLNEAAKYYPDMKEFATQQGTPIPKERKFEYRESAAAPKKSKTPSPTPTPIPVEPPVSVQVEPPYVPFVLPFVKHKTSAPPQVDVDVTRNMVVDPWLTSGNTQHLASPLPLTPLQAVKNFIPPNATQQPISDYLATPSSLDSTKETVNYIYSSLERQKKAIEQAIIKGQVSIARNLSNKLDAEVKDAQSFIQRFSEADTTDAESAQHLRSTVKGNITQKANFVTKANRAIDLVENDANPTEVRDAPNIPGGLKGFITRGILARRTENARNPNPDGNLEGGYFSPFARVPMLDFMDTPIESFKSTVQKAKNSLFNRQTATPVPPTPPTPPTNPNQDLQPDDDKGGLFGMPKLGTVQKYLQSFSEAFKHFGNTVKTGVSTLAGLFVLGKIGELMFNVGKVTVAAATNFENLSIRITAASSSVQAGRNLFASTTAFADKLGVSRSSALETAASVSGTTFGTELEGKPSERITQQITQIGQLRGLNDVQKDALTKAITEMLGSDRVDARRINELQQSAGITDVRAIGARSMGYSPEQFSNVQESGTGLNSKIFLTSFLRQAINDAQLSEGVMKDSNEYKQSKLAAKMQEGLSDVGTPINVIYKAGIDILTEAITFLNNNATKLANVLNGALLTGIAYVTVDMVKFFRNIDLEGKIFDALSSITLKGIGNFAKATLEMGVMAGLFYMIGDGVEYLSKKFGNAYQDIHDQSAALDITIAKIKNKGVVDDSELPDKNSEIEPTAKAGFMERVGIGLQRNVTVPIANGTQEFFGSPYNNPIYNNPVTRGFRKFVGVEDHLPTDVNKKLTGGKFGDDYEKKSFQRNEEFSNITEKIAESSKIVSEKADEVKGKFAEKDVEIAGLSTEKSGLFAKGNPDPTAASDLTKRFNKAYTERDALRGNLDQASLGAQQGLDAARNKQKKLEEDFKDKTITKDDYKKLSVQSEIDIKLAEAAQRKLNEAVKTGLSDLLPWTRELSKVKAKFEDINVQAQLAAQKVKIDRNNEEASGKRTQGQTDYINTVDRAKFIEIKNKAIDTTISEMNFTLTSRDPNAIKNVKKAYGVTDDTSSAQLRVLAETATNTQDKEVLAGMGVIRDKKNEKLSNLTEFSNIHHEAFRKMYEENKSAMLYYVSLAQQLDPVANAFADASAKVVQSKDTFLTKLNNYGTGLFDIYTTAYLGLLDAGKDKLEQQAKLAADKKAAIDAYENRTLAAEGVEYSRFTPTAKLNGGMNTGGRSTTQRNQPVSPQPSSRNNIVPLDRNSGQGVAGQYRGVGNPQNYVDAAELKSRALRDQQLKAAERNFKVAEATSGSELRKIQVMQKLQEDRILTGQVSAKKIRDRNLQNLDPNDEIGLQGKQNRARITQNNSLDDEKDVKINDVRQLTNSISNQKTTIRILQAIKNRTPEQEKALKQTISDLPRNESTVKSAQADLAGFDKRAASKKASQLEEQKYQLGVSAENIKLDEQTVKAEALKTELAGLNQQLSIQPFNIEGKAKARKIGDAIVEIEARSALIRANRKTTEQGRSDEQFDDVADAKARTAAKKNYDRTIANNAKKDAQEALKDKQAFDTETRVFGISGAGIKVGAASMAVRVSGQEDKGNVPFATTNTIQKEYDLKVEEFNKAKKEREDQYQKQIVHYKDSPFLKDVESQYADQNKLADQGLKNDAIDRDRQLNANAIGKRGYEFGQKIKSYDTDTAFKTTDMEGVRNRGGDTHEMEFDLAVRAKQKETASKLVDLQAQRDQITQTGDVADKAKAEIDKLIASTKELAVIDITNISDKFDRFNTVLGKVQSTTLEVFTTWETTGKFDWRKILLSGLDEALKQINTKLMGDLFKPLYRQSEKTATPDTKSVIIQGAESAANMLGTGGGIKNGEPGLLNSDGSVNESDSSSITRSFTPSIAQPQVANPIGQQVQSIVTNGLVKLALPGGGFTMMSQQDAISNGFINVDGSSTTAPKPIQTVEPITPNIEPISPVIQEPIDIPPSPIDEYDGFGTPQSGYDIRRLPVPNRRSRSDAGITGGGSGSSGIAGSLVSMVLPSLLHIFGLKDGDVVKSDPMFRNLREGEDPIAKALRKEGNDAVLAALTPGERILSLKQTSIYQTMFPEGIENHADGGVAGGATPVSLNLDPDKKNGGGDNHFHFDIDNSNRGADGQLQSRQLIEGLRSVVVQELIRQKRNGSGLLT